MEPTPRESEKQISFTDLQELVDRRIEEKFGGISLELREKIEKQIQERLDRDRDFLKTVVNAATKVLGGVVTIIIIVITLFGIKTFSDIQSAIQNAATGEVKKKLESDDPNSPFRRNIDALLNRAIINSYLTRIANVKGERFGRNRINIDEDDGIRLLNMLANQETSKEDFTDAINVLVKTSDEKLLSRVSSTFVNLAAANDTKYVWIAKEPEKRAIIIEKVSTNDLIPAMREIIEKDTDKLLRISALKYLARVKDSDSIKSIESLLSKTNDPETIQEILRALARLNPTNPVLATWIDENTKGSLDLPIAAKLLYIAQEVQKNSSNLLSENTSEEEKKNELIKNILLLVINKDFQFTVIENFDEEEPRLAVLKKDSRETSYYLPADLLFGRGASTPNLLLQQSIKKNDLTEFTKIVDAFSLKLEEQPVAIIRVIFSENASIKLANGQLLDQKIALGGAGLKVIQTAGNNELFVTWLDSTGSRRTEKVVGFSNSESLEFSLVTDKKFVNDESE